MFARKGALGEFMKYALRAAFAVALTAALGGCATVVRGTSEKFTVESSPPGAQVRTTTGFSCDSTPCTFKMPRKEKFDVTVSKQGYQSVQSHVRTVVAGGGATGLVGNAVVGGLIGVGVDVYSGAALDLSPNPLRVTLTPIGVDPSPATAAAPASPAPAVASGGAVTSK
jgi:hypothetical protein